SLGPGQRFSADTRRSPRNTDRGETLICCCVLLCTTEKYTAVCLHSKTHTEHTVKQHTVNPLITQMLTPFCPVLLVQCQCILLALITVLVSLGCQWQLVSSPQCPNACQSPAI
ncbi:unnamed protein product, partial [Staurois parvus]